MNTINPRIYEMKHFSQFGEDGVILKILETVKLSNEFYVEIGASPDECNTKNLRVNKHWKGIMLDKEASYFDSDIGLYTEEITPSNINNVLRKYDVPPNPDFMSIDIDGLDFHVWNNLAPEFHPTILCIEVNTHYVWDADIVVPLAEHFSWDYTDYFGGSVMAMNMVAELRDYVLAYVTHEGVNAFFVKRSAIPEDVEFLNQGNVQKLYRSIKNPPISGHSPDLKKRPYHKSWRYLENRRIEKALAVYHIDSPKLRLGPHRDGGYIVNQLLLDNSDRLISLGIGPSDAFELDWHITTHKPVELYDGESLPNKDFRMPEGFYVQRNIGIKNTEIPLGVLLVGKSSVLLKIDIEGGEYTIFSDVCLDNVTGIILEVHFLGNEEKKEEFIDIFLKKLAPQFYLFHIHVNNCDGGVLELSMINKNLVTSPPQLEIGKFPISGLDFRNNPYIPDIIPDWINT